MTTPRAAIVFNASTGSDTAASGLGPATAITGTAAAHTNGGASTTITLTNTPDLSGVVAGDLLWLDTASGRQFSVIASADDGADTVTVDDSFNIAGASAVNYAIGGKRATFDNADSRNLFSTSIKTLWIVETETDQTITSTGTNSPDPGTNGTVTVRGSSGAIKVINQTANAQTFGARETWCFENLKFTNSNGTKTLANAITGNGSTSIFLKDCIFGDATNTINAAFSHNSTTMIIANNCDFFKCVTAGLLNATNLSLRAHGCSWRECGIGIRGGAGQMDLHDCIIARSTTIGIDSDAGDWDMSGCVIHGNGGDGIEMGAVHVRGTIVNNNITGNGGWGIDAAAVQAASQQKILVDHNNYGTGALVNAGGSITGLAAGANDLAVDPGYTNAAGDNFEAGTGIKAQGFPDAAATLGAGQTATNVFLDIGIQREEAGGGGGLVNPIISAEGGLIIRAD